MNTQKHQLTLWQLFRAGGWFPIFVFVLHLFLKFGVNIYAYWRRADMPLHFIGGLSIAYFVSGAFRHLSEKIPASEREGMLELLLIIGLTAAAAVFWEFGEYLLDKVWATNLQGGLENTMQDLLLGMAGGAVMILIRARQLRVEEKVMQEFISD